jgi:hypothetical protein
VVMQRRYEAREPRVMTTTEHFRGISR